MFYHLSLPGTSAAIELSAYGALLYGMFAAAKGSGRQGGHWTHPEPHAGTKSCGSYSVDRGDMRDGRLRGTHGCCGFTVAPGEFVQFKCSRQGSSDAGGNT